MDSINGRRIVLFGKTGSGKSSTGNTILGQGNAFVVGNEAISTTKECKQQYKMIGDKNFVITDTPGFFDTRNDAEMMPEITNCITLCSPGPHVFLIVLKVETFSTLEEEVVKKITNSFGEEAFKYSIVLFTHGDQLIEGQTIQQYVEKNRALKILIEKCGDRCHVIDNKYWDKEHNYRSNKVQVQSLLNTIEEMIRQNGGGCYTNALLQAVEGEIQINERTMNRNDAMEHVSLKIRAAGLTTGALLGAFLGIPVLVFAGVYHVAKILPELLSLISKHMQEAGSAAAVAAGGGAAAVAGGGAAAEGGAAAIAAGGAAAEGGAAAVAAEGGAAAVAAGGAAAEGGAAAAGGGGAATAAQCGAGVAVKAAVFTGGLIMTAGAVAGGIVGWEASKDARSPGEAAFKAVGAVLDSTKNLFGKENK